MHQADGEAKADRQPRVRACTCRAGTGGGAQVRVAVIPRALQLFSFQKKHPPLPPRPPRTVTQKKNTAPSGALFSYASSRRWSKGRSTAASACLYGSGGYGRGCGTRREPIHGGSTCAIHGARRSRQGLAPTRQTDLDGRLGKPERPLRQAVTGLGPRASGLGPQVKGQRSKVKGQRSKVKGQKVKGQKVKRSTASNSRQAPIGACLRLTGS